MGLTCKFSLGFFVCELELMSGQIWLFWSTSFIDATQQLNMYCTKHIENLKLHAFKLKGFLSKFLEILETELF